MRAEADETAEAMKRCFTSANVPGSGGEAANVVDVLAGLGQNLARALQALGNTDPSAPPGAIQTHGAAVREAAYTIARGLSDVAAAIRELAKRQGYSGRETPKAP